MTRSSQSFDPYFSANEALEAAKKEHKPGKQVRSRTDVAGAKRGEKGTVVSKHEGTFYGVAFGSGLAFLPAQHVDDDSQPGYHPDGDNDADDVPPPSP